LYVVLRDLERSNAQADARLEELMSGVKKALKERQRSKAKESLKTFKRFQNRADKKRATESMIREVN